MSANRFCLRILSDDIYDYRCYTFDGTNSAQSREVAKRLKEIEKEYEFIRKHNFNVVDEFEKINDMINNLKLYVKSVYNFYWYSIRPHDDVCRFIKEIEHRIKVHKGDRLLAIRSFKRVLGNFEESISPKMIHKILTWLKKKNPLSFRCVKRGMKEEIISDIKKKGIKFDADFLCKFIDENNPMEYVKEWNVRPYVNGKRMKNNKIRSLLKKSFYERQVNSIRFRIISPNLGCLPKQVEDIIISYLGFEDKELLVSSPKNNIVSNTQTDITSNLIRSDCCNAMTIYNSGSGANTFYQCTQCRKYGVIKANGRYSTPSFNM